MKTICYIAHPDIAQSSSQQFLIETGAYSQAVEYVELVRWKNSRSLKQAQAQILSAEQIILQFPMYWYHAPGILFDWINDVWSSMKPSQLAGKTLGIVVVVGGKAEHYQAGAREGRTVSELLSNFEVLARHFKMKYKPIFAIHQFQYLTEIEKADLMWRYLYYLETIEPMDFNRYQQFLIEKATSFISPKVEQLSLEPYWQAFLNQLELQAGEIEELMGINLEEEL